MKRINLKCKNLSPNQRRLRLQELSGIPISEKNKRRLMTESVTQILPMKYHDRMKIQSSINKSFEDDEVDLEEILKEMGYSDEEDLRDEIDEDEGYNDFIGMMSRSELKQLIQSVVLDKMEEEDDLNEIIENLTR
jgi:hypothetical protein